MKNFLRRLFLPTPAPEISIVHVNFETPGSRKDPASNRRVWALVDALTAANHHASVHEERGVHIFVVHRFCDREWLERAKASDAIIVFDLDDDYFFSSDETDLIPFLEAAHVVTAESEIAKAFLSRYHPKVAHLPLQTIEANTWIFTIRNMFEKQALSYISDSVKGLLERTDLIVLADRNPEHVQRTLHSLHFEELRYKSVALLTASEDESYLHQLKNQSKSDLSILGGKVQDYFDIYKEMAFHLRNSQGQFVIFVAAGVEVFPGFFRGLLDIYSDKALSVIPVVEPNKTSVVIESKVNSLLELLSTPYLPYLCILPRVKEMKTEEINPQFGPFGLWEFLIRASQICGLQIKGTTSPLGSVSKELLGATPCDAYTHYVRDIDPERAKELRSAPLEWEDLAHVLQNEVIRSHAELFEIHMSALLSHLTLRIAQLRRKNLWLEAKLQKNETLEQLYKQTKGKLEDARKYIERLEEQKNQPATSTPQLRTYSSH